MVKISEPLNIPQILFLSTKVREEGDERSLEPGLCSSLVRDCSLVTRTWFFCVSGIQVTNFKNDLKDIISKYSRGPGVLTNVS